MKKISIELSKDEALVLFEWLSQVDKRKPLDSMDEAEQKVLWLLEGKLERILTEPFERDYQDLVQAAKRRLAGN